MLCRRKGHLQFFMKEYEKATATYEAGLQHDPENAELKDGIARCMEAVNKVSPGSDPGCIGWPRLAQFGHAIPS